MELSTGCVLFALDSSRNCLREVFELRSLSNLLFLSVVRLI